MLEVEQLPQVVPGKFEPISPPHSPLVAPSLLPGRFSADLPSCQGPLADSKADFRHGKVLRLSETPGNSIRDVFEHGSLLGSGTFGSVFAARERSTGEEVALKVIPKSRQYPGLFEHLGAPLIRCMLAFQHENVVRYGLLAEDASMVYVAMELYTGQDLFDFFMQECPLSRGRTFSVSGQVLSALAYIHDMGIVHCDIKPENFIFSTAVSETLKLIDFGSAMTQECAARDASGTLGFCAPEVFARGCSCASDVFSAGVIVFNALTGMWPEPMDQSCWQEADDSEALALYRQVLEQMAPDAVERWLEAALPGAGWSALRRLLGSMLHGHASCRPTAAEARELLLAAFAPSPSWQEGGVLPLVAAAPALGRREATEGEVRRCSSLLGATPSRKSGSSGPSFEQPPSSSQRSTGHRLCSRHYSLPICHLAKDDC